MQAPSPNAARTVAEPLALPPTIVVDIHGRDSDGELIAAPAEWDEVAGGPRQRSASMYQGGRRRHRGRRRRRALLRIEKAGDRSEIVSYLGRVMKVLDQARPRLLGHLQKIARRQRTADPGRQEAGGRGELNISKADSGGAEDGDWSASTWCARAALAWRPAR